ncbi:MAG TPA: glycosyltransferase family 4 protein [Opitutaceae bacterium]|nr:glycosyltransferase family 4 protein [Opitutaceae bacterium]
MRVAFLANKFFDPSRPGSWSGLPFFIRRALEDAGVETDVIGCEDSRRAACWMQFFYWRLMHRKRYLRYCHEGLLQGYARQIQRRLALHPRVDAVFSVSTWLLAFLQTELPTVLYTDACFSAMVGFYESFSNLAPCSIFEGHQAEQMALNRCSRIIYSTHWAARTAQEYYDVDPAKIRVVFYGGGLHDPPELEDISKLIRARDLTSCHLLLVGVDWHRKGADIAVHAAETLQTRGCNARLTIVGCRPPRPVRLPPFVEVIPFIDKGREEGRRQLHEIYKRSHFFILPSRAEASGVVFSEAAAYGLPALAADVGGISSVIINGVNGRLFSPAANGREYADYILSVTTDPGRYRALASRSLKEAATRLSWKVSGPKMAEILSELVAARADANPAANANFGTEPLRKS